MTDAQIDSLVAYNEWANRRMFDALGHLDEARFTKPLGSSFASVGDTVAHLVAAEWLWLSRWEGESATFPPEWVKDATLASLRERLDEVERRRAAMLGGDSGDPDREVTYTNFARETWRQPLRGLVVHMVNHASYHRGQVATMMRQLGAKPATTDYVVWMREMNPEARLTAGGR